MNNLLDDDGKLAERFRMKVKNAKEKGIKCLLSFKEYRALLAEAKITSSQIGRGGYHLARHGDHGPYVVGNCRFVHYKVNLAEQKIVRPDPAKISAGLKLFYVDNPSGFTDKKHSPETKAKIGAANSVHQQGSGNSQYGTCWIVRGSKEQKIRKELLDEFIALGWWQGRLSSKIKIQVETT